MICISSSAVTRYDAQVAVNITPVGGILESRGPYEGYSQVYRGGTKVQGLFSSLKGVERLKGSIEIYKTILNILEGSIQHAHGTSINGTGSSSIAQWHYECTRGQYKGTVSSTMVQGEFHSTVAL